ncbi:MAG: PAS domain S-box protein [Pseudomonadota bacterium]
MSSEPSYQNLKTKLAELNEERNQMAMMLKALRAIPLSTSFDQSARSIYDICKSLIGATCGYVALLSEDGSENEVLFLDDGGYPCSVDPNLPMPIQGLRSVAYSSGKAVYENNFMGSEWIDLMPPGHVRLDNVMFSPLNMGKKTIGVIGLANKPTGFTDQDKKTAASFSDIAILALKHGRLSDELREKEKLHREIIENISDSVLITDNAGTFTYICPNTRLIFGFNPEEIQSLNTIMNLLGKPIFNDEDLKEKQEIFNIPVEILNKNRQTRFLLANVKKVSIGRGTILYTFRDITEKRMADKKLEESEQKFRTIVNVLPQFVAYTDKELKYRFINKTYEEKLGVTAAAILNKTLVDVIGVQAFKKAKPHVEKVLKGKRVNYCERFSYNKGVTLDIDGTLIPDIQEDGKVNGYYAILTDITKYINAQEKLQTTENLFRRTFNQAPIGAAMVSLDFKFLRVNQELCRIVGYGAEDLLKIGFLDITHPDDLEKDVQYAQDLKKGLIDHYQMDKRYIRKNGDPIWIKLSVRLIRDTSGAPLLYLPMMEDIDDRKKQEEEIQRKQSELQAHASKLEEMNTALNVLIEHRYVEKQKREDEIIAGFKKLIFPYFDSSIKNKSREEISLIFDILNRNIKEVLFKGNESTELIFKTFTPLEVQVADLIKQNKSTKEIANILHTSVRAIYFHRENIRKKLNLTRNKNNLKTFLQTSK